MELIINSPKYGAFTVLYDAEDHHIIEKYSWAVLRSANGKFYVRTAEANAKQMTNILFGKKWIDHISGNTLDNRRSNLRPVTFAQNTWNREPIKNKTCRFKGVSFVEKRNRYHVNIMINGVSVFGGSFKNEYSAALRYNNLAKKYYGEYAWLNTLTKEEEDQGTEGMKDQYICPQRAKTSKISIF